MNWGFRDGFTGGRYTPKQYAQKAHQWFLQQGAEHGWTCLEYNDFGNHDYANAVREAVEELGDTFTIWMTRNFTAQEARAAVLACQPRGFLAEGEIPVEDASGASNPQAQDWPALIEALSDQPIYRGVVTNFAPFVYTRANDPDHPQGSAWPEQAAPLIAAGWDCITECYDLTGEPNLWPARRHSMASFCGWQESLPALGTYPPRSLESFPSRHGYRNWSCWAAEYLL